MITDLTGGKLVFIVAQINTTYLSSLPWFGPTTTMRLEITLFSLGILCISTFFFFFEGPEKNNSKLHKV